MAHRHERGAREAVTAAVGERGRRTGAAMPRQGDIPLTQDGFEDPDAFFKSPAAAPAKGKTRMRESPIAGPSNAYSQSHSQQLLSSASKRHQRRPDVTHEIGVRGRKTGMPIAPNGRIARTSDGMEDMDAFFAGNPASIPPLQRAKRISQIPEEDDDYLEEEDQTVNYNNRGGVSSAISRRTMNRDEEEYNQESEEDEQQTYSGDEAEYDEEYEQSLNDRTGVSSLHHGRRQSRRSDMHNMDVSLVYENQYDQSVEDDGGTKSMSLEGSSFFNKSNRSASAGRSVPVAAKSRLSTRSDIYDAVPSSPPQLQRSSPSSSGTPRTARNAVASTSRQRIEALQDPTSSDDENEQIQSSLTRSAQSRRRRSSIQAGAERSSASPTRDAKGKGRQSLFRAPSSEQHSVGVGGDYDNDDNDKDQGQGGFQPAGYDDDAGYNDMQQPYDGYPDEGQDYEADEQEDAQGAGREADEYSDEEPEDASRRRRREDSAAEEERYQHQYEQDEYDNDSEELPEPLSERDKRSSRAAANDSGHIEDEEESAVARGRGRTSQKPPSKPRKKYERRVIDYPEGVRRSRRDRTTPVAFWRNEHVIYQRRDSPSGAAYYEKVGVADRPTGPVRSLVNKHKRSRSASAGPNKRAKTRSVSVATDNEADVPQQGMDQDWTKWDEETDPDGIVWDYVDGKELQRRVAFTSTMLDPKATKHGYRFQRVFTDGEFLGAGLLIIPPGEKKPLKPAKDNTYVLFCHQGAVRVLVHRTEFSVAKGGFFLIPRGNSYQINNLTDIDAVLVFMQAKEVEAVMEEAEEEQ
ncbi:hypothetical protein P389DRAFT_105955 [Cystobasidium minutum MCA 4210]|uniref:uncharacterized protein n=1 Tax=Cystobasidium minutum MCA 4210 TaxID=1397322 RepID=UPI0034CD7868|eukprot:jgi/Rhomi1/105955/CE105954_665